MPTQAIFGGKKVVIPGAYSRVQSGIKNIVTPTYGVLVIDTGTFGSGFIGGAGITGTQKKGKDAIYTFTDIAAFRDFARGSYWWKIAEALFYPNGLIGNSVDQGASFVHFIKAATTLNGQITFTWTGGTGNGGVLVLDTNDEGLVANGVKTSTVLTRGFGATMEVGILDPAKFILKFWRGAFTGLDTDNQPWDGTLEANSNPILVAQSAEFSNFAEIADWCKTDSNFNLNFNVHSATIAGTGVVNTADMTATMATGIVLAAGGTETYNTTDVDAVLDNIPTLEYDFIVSDQFGDNAQSAKNTKFLSHIMNEAKYDKFLVIGGGKDSTKFTGTNSSIASAQYFNSERVIVCHGDVLQASNQIGSGFKQYNTLFKAALVAGRLCGLQPQVPITFKALNIDKEVHDLNEKEKTLALQNGVLATFNDDVVKQRVVLQGINTLQKNTFLINEDATTFSIQVRRIAAALNKMLVKDARTELFANPEGTNRHTLSAQVLVDWTSGKLLGVTAGQVDNLIIRFEKVAVVQDQDNYFVTYGFVPNNEITKVFFTGFMLAN